MHNAIYPCFWFDGTAKEAARFYCSVFPDSHITFESPMVVNFEVAGKKMMGLNGGPHFTINPSISLYVTCDTIEATNATWEKMLEGGNIMMPIDTYPWSQRYGWLQDRFGITWQITVKATDEEKSSITPSLLFTGENFGKGEAAIHFYKTVFKNSSTQVLVHYPDGDANAGKLLFAAYQLNEQPMITMDGPGEHAFRFNEAVSFVVPCDTQEEIDYYWEQLTSHGGKESRCGWLVDQFGISWQIIPSMLGELMSVPENAGKVMQELMKMNKIDIATLRNA